MSAGRKSDRIRESFQTPTIRLDEESLDRLVKLTDLDGVDLLDWQTKGIPAPDGAWGVFRVEPDAAGAAARLLLELGHFHWWLPRGIPVDHFDVHVSNVAPRF